MGAGVMQESQKMPLAVTDLEIILVLIVAAFLVAPDVSEIELAGVGKLTPEQQTEVKEHVKELDQQRVSFIGLRRLVVRIGLDPFYHFVMGKIKHVRQKLAGKPVYADVFEAAMQTDYILTDPVETVNGNV